MCAYSKKYGILDNTLQYYNVNVLSIEQLATKYASNIV